MPITAVFDEEVDQATLDNLHQDLLSKGGSEDQLRLYSLGYIARGGFCFRGGLAWSRGLTH